MKGSMLPISTRSAPVVVEYDCYGKRRRKLFQQAIEARVFYVLKFKQGRNPKVRKEDNNAK